MCYFLFSCTRPVWFQLIYYSPSCLLSPSLRCLCDRVFFHSYIYIYTPIPGILLLALEFPDDVGGGFLGRAAALATIAVQESAKEVAGWLKRLSAGGVAVIEAG